MDIEPHKRMQLQTTQLYCTVKITFSANRCLIMTVQVPTKILIITL